MDLRSGRLSTRLGTSPKLMGETKQGRESEMATSTTTRKTTTTERVTRKVSSVVISTEIAEAVKELKKLRSIANEINKEKEAITDLIKTALGNAEAGVFGGEIVVEQSKRSRRTIDYDLLQENFIEAYNATVGQSEYVVLK